MASSGLAGGEVQGLVKVLQLGAEFVQVAACAIRGGTQCNRNGKLGCRHANGEDLVSASVRVLDTDGTTRDGTGWAITPAHGSFAAHPSRAGGVAEGAVESVVVCVFGKKFVSFK